MNQLDLQPHYLQDLAKLAFQVIAPCALTSKKRAQYRSRAKALYRKVKSIQLLVTPKERVVTPNGRKKRRLSSGPTQPT